MCMQRDLKRKRRRVGGSKISDVIYFLYNNEASYIKIFVATFIF